MENQKKRQVSFTFIFIPKMNKKENIQRGLEMVMLKINQTMKKFFTKVEVSKKIKEKYCNLHSSNI